MVRTTTVISVRCTSAPLFCCHDDLWASSKADITAFLFISVLFKRSYGSNAGALPPYQHGLASIQPASNVLTGRAGWWRLNASRCCQDVCFPSVEPGLIKVSNNHFPAWRAAIASGLVNPSSWRCGTLNYWSVPSFRGWGCAFRCLS